MRQEEVAEEASTSSKSQEDSAEELSSSLDPITISSSNSKGEHEETATTSQPDNDPDLSPVPTRRPVTRSTPKKLTSRPK